jgi:hypothetical protein
MVGWLGAVLHSAMAPGDFLAKPEPDTITVWPFLRLVWGVTLNLALPAADSPVQAKMPIAKIVGKKYFIVSLLGLGCNSTFAIKTPFK